MSRETMFTPAYFADANNFDLIFNRVLGSNCWNWKGNVFHNKPNNQFTHSSYYGRIAYSHGRSPLRPGIEGWGPHDIVCERAHRVAYMFHYGVNPLKLCVRHKCDNPLCVNPLHLELGTRGENNRDRAERGLNKHYVRTKMRATRTSDKKTTLDFMATSI